MADDASGVLGAPEIAGTFVNPKGMTKKVTASVAGGEIASAELDEGRLLSHLKIVFGNGVAWEFDIPKANKKSASLWSGRWVSTGVRKHAQFRRPPITVGQPRRSHVLPNTGTRRRRARATGCRCRRPASAGRRRSPRPSAAARPGSRAA